MNWEEYSLKIVHFPGQTEYHMAMAVDTDGKRVVFTGDSLGDDGEKLVQPIIHRNIVTAENHMKCARNLAELDPDVLAHGHGGWFPVDRERVKTLRGRAENTKSMFDALLPEPSVLGVNPGWIKLVPYQSTVGAEESLELELEVHNYYDRPISIEADLVVHEGWKYSPENNRAQIAPGETDRLQYQLKVGPVADRYGIAADVTINSKRIGQVAEAIVKVE